MMKLLSLGSNERLPPDEEEADAWVYCGLRKSPIHLVSVSRGLIARDGGKRKVSKRNLALDLS